MPTTGHHPHGTTAYAPPVTCRAPSPASSIGTVYDDDATSDVENEMSPFEFECFCEDKIKLGQPRPEEERAERDPLIRDKWRSTGGWQEEELVARIRDNLRAEIKIIEDEEIYERAMMKGSQIGLELQPPTSDIDKIMRSMMSTGFSLTADSNNARNTSTSHPATSTPPFSNKTAAKPAVTNGPWNNYGKKPNSVKSPLFPVIGLSQMTSTSGRSNSVAPTTSFASSTTTGTNTTMDDAMAVEHQGLALLSPDVSGVFTQPRSKSIPKLRGQDVSKREGTVVGGKRTRSGLSRR